MKQVLIFGIERRSGTNYLASVLNLYPNSLQLDNPSEDYLIQNSNLLIEYINKVEKDWNSKWKSNKQALVDSISAGLNNFLKPVDDFDLYISKTPSTVNIKNVFTFFPAAKILIIIRRGQDLAESGKKSFNWPYEYTYRKWKNSANRIIDLEKSNGENVKIVHYESLINNSNNTIKDILNFCELDKNVFDFNKIESVPVKGSSTFGKEDKVHWEPIKRNDDFNPVGRSNNWSRWRHFRFNWICRKESEYFKYDLLYKEKSILYYLYNIFFDAFYGSIKIIYNTFIPLTGKFLKRIKILPKHAPLKLEF